MSLTISQVFAQAKDDVSLVFDNPIYYLVLNKDDNTFTDKTIETINKHLEKVDKHSDSAVLVTLSSTKKFSSGFDPKFWNQSV